MRIQTVSLFALASLLLADSAANADYIYIDSVLGYRSHFVDGLTAASSQSDVAREATRLALAPEGWDLASLGGWAIRFDGGGEHYYNLDSTGSLVFDHTDAFIWTGTSWGLWGLPEAQSENLGYSASGTGYRHLVFHTDDVATHGAHNMGEPSGFGTIVGAKSGSWVQLGQQDWGTFGVTAIPEPSTALLLTTGLLELAIRRARSRS